MSETKKPDQPGHAETALLWDPISQDCYGDRFNPGHEFKIVSQRGTHYGNSAFYVTHAHDTYIGLCVDRGKYVWVEYRHIAKTPGDKSTACYGDDMSSADGNFECEVFIRKTGPVSR